MADGVGATSRAAQGTPSAARVRRLDGDTGRRGEWCETGIRTVGLAGGKERRAGRGAIAPRGESGARL